MTTRLIDIFATNGNILHTFPITIGNEGEVLGDAAYMAKALEAATFARLVPDSEFPGVTARVHVSRGGPLEPFGDKLDSNAETKSSLDEEVRKNAYYLWEQDGRPEGHADEHWYRALERQHRERAHSIWEQEGCPEGSAEGNWLRVERFQKQ
jgi:hypothetical protein